MNPCRVLFVSGTVPPTACGVGDYTLKLASTLAARGGIETAILTGVSSTAAGASTAADVSCAVTIFPLLNSWSLHQTGRVVRFLREWRPDVVHVQYPTQGYGRGMLPYAIPLIARMLGVRSVQTWHEALGRSRAATLRFLLQLGGGSSKVVVRGNFMDLVHPWPQALLRHCKLAFIPNASAIPRASCSAEELLEEKRTWLSGQKRLIVFFGFLYPFKGAELLFEIADPRTDHIVIAGAADEGSPYLAALKASAVSDRWRGKVTFTGFLPPDRAAVLLAASDAVILPFRQGGGHWNTSIHSATLNGCFVITTSRDRAGYHESTRVFYARPDDVEQMRGALAAYCGRINAIDQKKEEYRDEWDSIAQRHCEVYENLLAGP